MVASALKDGDRIRSKFAVRSKNWLREYRNKPGRYFSIEVGDETGNIGLKYWGGADESSVIRLYDSFSEGSVIEVSGDVIADQYEKRLVIHVNEDSGIFRVCAKGEYTEDNFLPKGTHDPEKLYAELVSFIDKISSTHLKTLLTSFFCDGEFVEIFKKIPASVNRHHAYVGGCLEHTLSVTKICNETCDIYPELDRDMLITASMLHDVGKLGEYTLTSIIGRSDEGKLLGHLALGERMVSAKIAEIPEFPNELRLKLLHAVLSHHAKTEDDILVGVKTPEACVLHKANCLDTSVSWILKERSSGSDDGSGWVYSHTLGHEIYRK